MAIHNCSECDYCYTNETLNGMYLCVNGDSEYCGDFIDGMGLANEDYDCVVIDGKIRCEIDEDDELLTLDDEEECDYD